MSYNGRRYPQRGYVGGNRSTPRGQYGGAKRYQVSAARWNEPASDAQIGKLRTMLTERQLFDDPYDRLWDKMSSHERRVRYEKYNDGEIGVSDEEAASLEADHGEYLLMGPTSQIISWVLENTDDPTPAGTPLGQRSKQLAELGVYAGCIALRIGTERTFVVREFQPPGEDHKVRYAREIVESRAVHGHESDDEGWNFDEIPARGMQWQLTAEDAMPEADYKAFCQKYGKCISCRRRLKAKKSLDQGRGDICHGRQMRLLASRMVSA